MAEHKHEDVRFWLPSDFLTDEDILMDTKENFNKYRLDFSNSSALHCFPSQFPHFYGSPVESSMGSADTESDEEDSLLLSDLTRHLKISGISPPTHSHEKGMLLSTSPQSTLAQVGSWSGRSTVSSSGSPNGPSQVSSPPTTPLSSKNDAWDLIYQAASQVARLKVNAGDGLSTIPTAISGAQKWFMTPQPLKAPVGSAFHLSQLQQGMDNELLKQGGCGMGRRDAKTRWSYEQDLSLHKAGTGCWNIKGGRGFDPPPCAWPPSLQIQQRKYLHPGNFGFREGINCSFDYGYGFGYGSSGVNGGGGGLKKERTGTGVFLPRRYGNMMNTPGNMSDYRNKPGGLSSPVHLLRPGRAMPELNKMSGCGNCVSQSRGGRNGLGPPADYETLVARRNGGGQQLRSAGTELPSSMNHEICLPQEWTY